MITKIIHEEKIQKAKKYVEKGESFVIVTHVTPDGDACLMTKEVAVCIVQG